MFAGVVNVTVVWGRCSGRPFVQFPRLTSSQTFFYDRFRSLELSQTLRSRAVDRRTAHNCHNEITIIV